MNALTTPLARPLTVVVALLRRYVGARKAWHLAVTVTFLLIEVIAIGAFHEVMIHIALTGSIGTWETLLVLVAEE